MAAVLCRPLSPRACCVTREWCSWKRMTVRGTSTVCYSRSLRNSTQRAVPKLLVMVERALPLFLTAVLVRSCGECRADQAVLWSLNLDDEDSHDESRGEARASINEGGCCLFEVIATQAKKNVSASLCTRPAWAFFRKAVITCLRNGFSKACL